MKNGLALKKSGQKRTPAPLHKLELRREKTYWNACGWPSIIWLFNMKGNPLDKNAFIAVFYTEGICLKTSPIKSWKELIEPFEIQRWLAQLKKPMWKLTKGCAILVTSFYWSLPENISIQKTGENGLVFRLNPLGGYRREKRDFCFWCGNPCLPGVPKFSNRRSPWICFGELRLHPLWKIWCNCYIN